MVNARPRLLDLFCGAGGAAMGYHRAGFDVVGVDIKPQPNYPFEFIQADALSVLGVLGDAVVDVVGDQERVRLPSLRGFLPADGLLGEGLGSGGLGGLNARVVRASTAYRDSLAIDIGQGDGAEGISGLLDEHPESHGSSIRDGDNATIPRSGASVEVGDGDTFLPRLALESFAAIHASPPCQAFTAYRRTGRVGDYPDLIAPLRKLLYATDLPYVIENVDGAPLWEAELICGSMFDPPMVIRRHRLFETNWPLEPPMWPCRHKLWGNQRIYPGGRSRERGNARTPARATVEIGRWNIPLDVQQEAMGIDWMTLEELSEAIPPAYTEFIGRQLLSHVRNDGFGCPACAEENGGWHCTQGDGCIVEEAFASPDADITKVKS